MKQNIVQSLVERVAAIDKRLQNLERLRGAPNLAMRDLTDTQIASLSNNQSLVWDTRKQTWVPASPRDIVFSYAQAVGTEISPPYVPKVSVVVVGMALSVGKVGTADSMVTLSRRGSPIMTLTLAANAAYVQASLPTNVAGNFNARLDAMTVQAAPGTGLADLVVTIEVG